MDVLNDKDRVLRSAYLSGGIHILLLIICIFGLPHLKKETPYGDMVEVEIISESSDIPKIMAAAPPPKPEPKPEPKPKPQPEPEPKPEPTPPEPKPEPQPEPEPKPDPQPEPPAPEKAEIVNEVPKEELIPVPLPTTRPKAPPKPQLAENKPKPDQKPQETKPDDSLNDLLSELSNTPTPTQQTTSESTLPPASKKPGNPLSKSEMDALRSQISNNWNKPPGSENVRITVVIRVTFTPQGQVTATQILDKKGNVTPQLVNATALSAERAVKRSSPLRLPETLAQNVEPLELTFYSDER